MRTRPELLQLVSPPADQLQAAPVLSAAEAMPALVKEPGEVSITISEQTRLANRSGVALTKRVNLT